MTYELVKFTVDMFAPGAVLSHNLTNYLSKWNDIHSRRTLYPIKPLEELMDIRRDEVKEDFFHIRVNPIGDQTYGIADGEIDSLLVREAMEVVFGADLERIAAHAMNISQPYGKVINRTYACWVDLYEVSGMEKVKFIRSASVKEIATLLTKDAPNT